MNEFQALILGLLQGLTEFLPVSSSGHLEIGHALLNVQTPNNLLFAVVVHVATVMSTIVVFRKDILTLISQFFTRGWNESKDYVYKLMFSAIPVGILGVFFAEDIEQFFTGNLVFVGSMLLITSSLLAFAHFAPAGMGKITWLRAILIGVAQAMAVLPGISRSGATISAGLLLKTRKDEVARFSFLMVLIPILGAAFLDVVGGDFSEEGTIGMGPLIVGFLAAFISGLIACSFMIRIVKRGKLIYFAVYCLIVGLIAIFAG